MEGLLDGVELLSLDAGNTIVFLDHARLAKLACDAGYDVTVSRLIATEGEAKRMLEDHSILELDWSCRALPGARSWGNFLGTMLVRAGFPLERVGPFLDVLWPQHLEFNLYSQVPEGLGEALDAARRHGVKVCVVSNAEGTIAPLFARLGIDAHFDLLVDSGILGIEKPDRRIFEAALAPFGVPPHRALHLGDTFATDVVGARGAGLRAALIDPHRLYAGRHADVPRVDGVVAVARALVDLRARPPECAAL